MPRKESLLHRAASSLAKALTRVVGRRDEPARERVTGSDDGNGRARHARRQTDIPMDQIATAYTPTQTSLKGPFRASGADRSRDQEFAGGFADERWNDEDHYTNKSGDPRIGTHGRAYEPGEKQR
jgi:hypothetical protein